MEPTVPAHHVDEAARWLNEQLRGQLPPALAIIAGSGLGALAEQIASPTIVPTHQVPHWPHSTVEGHAGRLVIGSLGGVPTLLMQGRVHFYEGYPIQQVTFPVRVLHALGIRRLVVTNAAGGLEPTWAAGDIMLIADHINLPGMAGNNPLIGPNDSAVGPRFPNMANAYSPRLRALAHEVAAALGMTLREGIYAMVSGPSYETPAELRLLHRAGAHAVGMSTAPEVIVARHAGMEVLGISLLTNMALVDPDPDDETSHEEVLEMGARVAPRLVRLLEGVLERVGQNP